MMNPLIDLSVIIVNWNARDLLKQCLWSILKTPSQTKLEVIVVDNASSDNSSVMVLEEFPDVRLLQNSRNAGFAAANNQAICQSTGQWVLLLNSDTIVKPGAIDALMGFARSRSEAGIVGCKLLNPDLTLQPSWGGFPSFLSELTGRNIRKRKWVASAGAYQVDWVSGACLLAQRQAIESVGLLDEAYFMYSEETDWCLRMKMRGWKTYYYPHAQVVHFTGSSTTKALYSMVVHLYESKLRFFQKFYGPIQEKTLRVSIIACSLIKGILSVIFTRVNIVESSERFSARRHFYVAKMLLKNFKLF